MAQSIWTNLRSTCLSPHDVSRWCFFFFCNEPQFTALLSFEVLSAFKITLAVESFRVLGAFFPTLLDSLFLLLFLFVYITAMTLVHKHREHFIEFENVVANTRFVFTSITALSIICIIFQVIKYSHVSEIANSILDKSI